MQLFFDWSNVHLMTLYLQSIVRRDYPLKKKLCWIFHCFRCYTNNWNHHHCWVDTLNSPCQHDHHSSSHSYFFPFRRISATIKISRNPFFIFQETYNINKLVYMHLKSMFSIFDHCFDNLFSLFTEIEQ